MINRQWLLAANRTGAVERDDLALMQTEAPEPIAGSGKVLIRMEMLLCAPTIGNWISGNRSSYYPIAVLAARVRTSPTPGR